MKISFEDAAEEGQAIYDIVRDKGFLYIEFDNEDFCLYEYGAFPDGTAYLEESQLDLPPKFITDERSFAWEEV